MPRKKEACVELHELVDGAEDMVETLFVKGAKTVRPKYKNALAVLVPCVAIVPRGAAVPPVVEDAILDGHFVVLDGASRTAVRKALDVRPAPNKANTKGVDVLLDYDLEGSG